MRVSFKESEREFKESPFHSISSDYYQKIAQSKIAMIWPGALKGSDCPKASELGNLTISYHLQASPTKQEFFHISALMKSAQLICHHKLPLDNISSSHYCPSQCLSTWYLVSSFLRVTTASSMYVRGAYGWLRQGLLDWFVAPTSALYHPTVSVCFAPLCLCAPHILFLSATCQSVLSEAAGGEYLHKYWTKTGRNSRTATGLILDKYFTRPTNTPGGGGGVWGACRMRRILANTHWGGM